MIYIFSIVLLQVVMLTKLMDGANQSVVAEFVLLGLTNSWEIQLLLFVFSSTFYVASMMGNSLIILTVTCDPHLHSPMYFLLANLSFIDLGVSSVTSRKMIYDLFRKHKVISFRSALLRSSSSTSLVVWR